MENYTRVPKEKTADGSVAENEVMIVLMPGIDIAIA